MRIKELINILQGYNGELEALACSEEEIFQINQASLREVTLYETANSAIVDSTDYNPSEDGKITGVRNVLLIDLDI